jgi:tagatose-1,6-bisphosphate aldolase non-catalytic subunit AgaZ/GatZ
MDSENSEKLDDPETQEKPEKPNKPEKKPEKNDPIVQQNINIWRSYWEQRITETNADIEFIYRDEIEKAHAYSKSVLLSAVADSISKAHQIHEDLPRHVIAQYFVHALEEYVKGQPGLNIEASKKRLEGIKDILFYRTEGNE